MNSLNLQMAIMSAASGAVEFAINWLAQSTLLIVSGLLLARYLQRQGAAAQSLIYRTTLAAVLLCPIATCVLGRIGVSGWSIALAPAYQMTRIDPTDVSATAHASPTNENLPPFSSKPDTVENSLANVVDGNEASVEPPPSANVGTDSNVSSNRTMPQTLPESKSAIESSTIAASELWRFEVYWLGFVSPFVLLAWVAISGGLLARLASSWWKMSRLLRGADRADESTMQLCHRLANELSVTDPDVLISPFIPSPCLAGIGLAKRASILLPNDDLNLPMRDVLVHELAHLRRLDCHWNLARQIATAIYWFQPLMWMLSRRIEITAEEVCDDIVVSTGGNRHDYAHRLVDIAELSADVSAAAVAAAGVGIVSLRSMLARRVERILDTSRSLSTRVGNALMITVLISGIIGTAIVGLVGLNQPVVVAVEETGGDATGAETDTRSNSGEVEHYAGKVVDPNGNPVADADIFIKFYRSEATGLLESNLKPIAKSKEDGRFSFQFDREKHQVASTYESNFATLVAVKDGFGLASAGSKKFETGRIHEADSNATFKLIEDHPVRGRITDINGQPVVGAKLTLFELSYNDENDLNGWNTDAKKPRADYYSVRDQASLVLGGSSLGSTVKPGWTNAKGEFEISGIGKGRIACLLLEGPNIETQKLEVRTERGDIVSLPLQFRDPKLGSLTYYPSQFEHVAGPSIPVTGVVRDLATGKPIAGATIKSQTLHGQKISGWGKDFIRAITDADGKFRLTGLPLGSDNRITAIVPDGEVAYLSQSLPANTAAATGNPSKIEVNFEVSSGVWLKGRITDASTGEGLAGSVEYCVAAENPKSDLLRERVDERDRLLSNGEGRFRIAVLPGRGFIGFVADKHENYPRASGITKADLSIEKVPRFIDSRPTYMHAPNYHLVAEITPNEAATEYDVKYTLEGGTMRTGSVVDNEGNKVDEYCFFGHMPQFSNWRWVKEKEFVLKAYRPEVARPVYVAVPEKGLTGFSIVRGDPKQPLTIQVGPGGSARGRLVDEGGEPLVNRPLLPWSRSIPSPADMAEQLPSQPPFFHRSLQLHNLSTDEEGRFEFTCLLPDTEYRLSAKPSDDAYFTPIDMVIRVAAGETQDLGDVRIVDDTEAFEKSTEEALQQTQTKKEPVGKPVSAASNKAMVQVTRPDGSPAANTHVAVVGYDLEKGEMKIFVESITDAQGHCPIDNDIFPSDSSPQNIRFLIARRDGYGIGWKLLGGPSTPPLNGQSTIDVKLHEEGIVEGKLIDVDGQPAAGESLQIEMIMNPASSTRMFENSVGFRSKPDMKRPTAWVPSVTTDASGRFKLTGIPKEHGIYMSLVNSKRFAPQDIAINTGEPEQRGPRDGTYRALVKNVKPGEEAVIAIDPAKIFTGTITYEDSGEPVPGAKVSIWASQEEFGSMMSVECVTDVQGKYRVLPNPGIRFGVTAYPPSGVPYMARETERIAWESSELTREVNIKVPRVSLVRGRVIEEGTDKPVEGATITFEAGGGQGGMPANVVTGWQVQRTTDADGNFTFAVPYGRGTLLVKKKNANYVLQHKLSREIQSGKPGGSRIYAHALHEVNTSNDNDSIEVEIRIKPGHEVSGKIVDEQGKPIGTALLATNLDVWDYTGEWRGGSGPTLGGTFRLKGLTADQEQVVYFVDPHQKLGATVKLRASDEPLSVVLKPCGSAKAKFVLDKEDRQFSPMLFFVLTPGELKYDFDAMKAGKTLADSDFVANVDRINYGNPQEAQEGKERYYTFPALIPGATYRLLISGGINGPYKDFKVKSGETLDLGEFTPKFED